MNAGGANAPVPVDQAPERNGGGLDGARGLNPLHAIAALGRGLGYVPDKGEPGAPKTWKGDADKLDDFLDKVKRILTACGIQSDEEKVKILFGYLGGDAKAFVREQPAYKEPDYDSLVEVIRAAYPSPKNQFRYTSRDLERLVRKYHDKKLKHLEDLAEYQRRFQKVGLWLLSHNKIEQERYNRMFWDGLPRTWQQQLKNNGDKFGLVIVHQETPQATEVLEAMRSALSYENFDADLLYRKSKPRKSRRSKRRSSSSDSDSSSDSSSDSDSDHGGYDSDSDSASDSDSTKARRHKTKKGKAKSTNTVSYPEAGDAERLIQSALDKAFGKHQEHTSAATRVESSIDALVRRLQGLDHGSTEYMLIWADLVKVAPNVANAVGAPVTANQVAVNAVQYNRPRAGNYDPRCYGCGEPGHQMRDCAAVQAYVDEGILWRTPDGRIRLTGGAMPYYGADKPLVKVLREQGTIPRKIPYTIPGTQPNVNGNANATATGPQVHNVRFAELVSPVNESYALGVQHNTPTAQMGGPAANTRSAARKAAAATGTAVPGLIPMTQVRGEADNSPTGGDAAPDAPADPPTDSVPQEHEPDPEVAASVVGATGAPTEAIHDKPPLRYTLVSGTDKEYGSKVTAKNILEQQVSVPMGALLSQPGIQKAIFPMVQRHRYFDTHNADLEQGKSDDEVPVGLIERQIISALYSSGVGKASVSIHGMSLTAVLDSGSEINVMSRDTATLLELPLTDYHGTMRTADGHTTPMRHVTCNVQLELGGVISMAHFYVVDGPNYQLLLGRPWQRQVSFEHKDKADGLMVTITDPVTSREYSFLAASCEKSETRCAYSGVSSASETDPSPIENKEQESEEQSETKLVAGAYKPVARKVRPIATSITETDRIKLNLPADIESDLPPLPHHPNKFEPGQRLTRDRLNRMELDPDDMLTPEELDLLVWVLRTNERALAFDETEKGAADPNIVPPIRIPVVEHEVWDHKNIRLSPALKEQVNTLLQTKVDSGLYEPSSAAYTSRWFPVAKKTPGQYRIVHDLQPLKAVAVRNPGRLPSIDEFVGDLSGRACVGIIDMFSGFDQIWLAVESRDYTTFETDIGRFRHTRLPQGATNSCIVFHYIVVAVVGPTGKVYVDDVVVPGPTSRYNDQAIPENPAIRRFVYEHLGNLHRVLWRLGKVGMTVSGHKMAPIRQSVTVLGQEISDKGRRVTQDKVDTIERWGACTSVTEVRSFLGIAGQARSWIPNYSVLVKPLTHLTKKDTPFEWGPEQQLAMEQIKTIVRQRAHLVELRYGKDAEPIQLGVDAGPLACGFWLGQKDENGIIQVARYGSLPFNEREQRYSQPKRELYAVFRALKYFHHWLYGAKVIIRTDASYVKGMIANPELPSSAMTRWLAYIMLFDTEVVHVPARNHALADGLSRRPAQPEDSSVTDDDDWLENRFEESVKATSVSNEKHNETYRAELNEPNTKTTELTTPILQVLSIAGTEDLEKTDLDLKLSTAHQEIFDFLTSGKKPLTANNYQKNRNFLRKVNRYFVTGQALWRKGGIEETGRLVIDDERERLRVIKELHDESGHKGVGATIHALERRFYWSGLGNTVKEWVRTCDTCQKRERGIAETAVRPTLPPSLFQRFGLDITYLPKTGGYRYLVVARDDLSGWVVARALKKKTARAVARFLVEEIFTRHGLPLLITTDQGTEFKGIVSILLQKYKIDIARTSAFNPRANGAVERGHKSLKDALVHTARSLDVPWHQVVHLACWIDRTMVRRQYGHTPFFLVYGHEPILPVDLSTTDLLTRYAQVPDDEDALLLAIKDRIVQLGSHKELLDLAQKRKAEDRQRSAARRNLQDMLGKPSYAPGQLVLVRNFNLLNNHTAESKTEDRWLGPFIVITQSIHGGVWLKSPSGVVLPSSIHPSHVKAYRPRIRPVFAHEGAEEP